MPEFRMGRVEFAPPTQMDVRVLAAAVEELQEQVKIQQRAIRTLLDDRLQVMKTMREVLEIQQGLIKAVRDRDGESF